MAMPERGAGREDGERRISIPTEGGDRHQLQRGTERDICAAKLERRLNIFVQFVASWEWSGNALGALAFLLATGVLLGGFGDDLKPMDFWLITVMVSIEAFRIYCRHFKVDNQSIFGTTKAIRWISSYFSHMLWRPQKGDEVVLFMGLCINLVYQLPIPFFAYNENIGGFVSITQVALLVFISRGPRWPRVFQIWTLLIAYSVMAAYQVKNLSGPYYDRSTTRCNIFWDMAAIVALLLLNLRPRRIANIASSPFGRQLIYFAKGILSIWLACDLVWNITVSYPYYESIPLAVTIDYICVTLLSKVVLFLGSLQAPVKSDMFGQWVDSILHISYLSDLVFPLNSFLYRFAADHKSISNSILLVCLSWLTLLVLMLIGNMQIPAAITQVFFSSVRFHYLPYVEYPQTEDAQEKNLVHAIQFFYMLTICQGSLYIVSCIFGIFSFFLRRSLVRRSNFDSRWQGAKAIDLYYHHAYAMCTDSGLRAARKTMSLASFAMESLHSSSSSEMQLAGLVLLDNLLSQETDSSQELKSRIISSNQALSMLIGMLGWSGVRDRDIRLFAARVTVKLADSVGIAGIPRIVKLVPSLLHAGNQNQPTSQQAITSVSLINGESVVANQPSSDEPSAQGTSSTRGCSWVCQWKKWKARWSILEQPFLPYQDFPILGLVILEKLACDIDNCAKMLKTSDFIPKIIGLISYTSHKDSNSSDQQNAVIRLSLYLVRRLASTGGEIGATVRNKLWDSPFLLDNLAGIFEDSRSSPEIWTPVMDIIAKLALHEDARGEIGTNQVIIGKLIRGFLGRDGPHNQSLRMAAGEALVNLSMESPANCSVILEESGYELVKDLKDMICEAEYRTYISVAANLLQNLCVHSREKLMSHPGAGEHLRSALPTVMEKIVSAEGKQLEALIGFASHICSNPEYFIFELDSEANQTGGLVKRLVDTLNSNRKPSPDYPRMRRVIVEMVISLVTTYPIYRTRFRDEGMMESMSHTVRTPSKVENYRVFCGDEGVVVESGKPLHELVDRAKGLIGTAIPTPALN